MAEEILEIARLYFTEIGENLSDEFIFSLINSLIDYYKVLRNYPDAYTDEMIEADVNRYFSRRKNNVAMEILPEMYGRIGGEGLAMMVDAGTTRYWKNMTILNDVTPICEIL